jgi:hypothetical protein
MLPHSAVSGPRAEQVRDAGTAMCGQVSKWQPRLGQFSNCRERRATGGIVSSSPDRPLTLTAVALSPSGA